MARLSKSSKFFKILIFLAPLLILSTSILQSECNIVGIDFGEKHIKAVTITPQKTFEIVLGTQSNRKIFNAITFEVEEQLRNLGPTTPTRVFGNEVESFSVKRAQTSFIGSLSYLGKHNEIDETSPAVLGVTQYSHFYPIGHNVDENRGSWKFNINSETSLQPEEVVAHILSHIKARVTDTLHIPNNKTISCVMTVPCSFTQRQRQALRDAAEIAGFYILSMVHSNLAAAVEYALDVPFDNSKTILFLSMGSQRADISIAKFNKMNQTSNSPLAPQNSIKLLSCISNEFTGGQHIDLAIADSMAEEFQKLYGVSLHEKPRALKMLLRQSTKVKHVLSANKETKFSIESLYNDIDFKYKFSRQKLDSIIADMGFIKKLKDSINLTLSEANLTMSDLDGVELLGGTWRTPYIYNELKQIFSPLDLGQHLNSDEAIAKGAAFIATSQSAHYQVRPIEMMDISGKFYSFALEGISDQDSENSSSSNKNYTLLSPNSKIQSTKKVSLYRSEDFIGKLYENDNLLYTYNITGISEACQNSYKGLATPKVQLVFKISSSGIIHLSDANAIFKENYNETVTLEIKNPTNSSDLTSSPEDYPSQANLESMNNTETSTNDTLKGASENEFTSQNSTAETNHSNSTSEAQPKFETKVVEKTKTHTQPLNIDTLESKPIPMTIYQKSKAKKTLDYFNNKDNLASSLAHERNAFESYIYHSKSQLYNEVYKSVASESKLNEVSQMLSDNENWLYDVPLANLTEVSEKFKETKNAIEPLNVLANEFEVRPYISELMNKFLEKEVANLYNMSETMPWVNPNITYTLKPELENVQNWWIMVKDKQITLPFDTFPAFTQSEVHEKINQYVNKKSAIEKIPPPPPPQTSINQTSTDNSTNTAQDHTNKTKTDNAQTNEPNSTYNNTEQYDNNNANSGQQTNNTSGNEFGTNKKGNNRDEL